MELHGLIFVFVCFTLSAANEVSSEIVLLHDLNSDHDRRHLDAGLPSHLEFNLQRRTGKVKLSLLENKRLNPNAPMHELVDEADGKRRLVKKKHIPIEKERFYHDKTNGGAFSVRCELSDAGPCRRMLFGSLQIDSKHYEISPAPADLSHKTVFRSADFSGTPHVLKAVEIPDNRRYRRSRFPEEPVAEFDEITMPPPERELRAETAPLNAKVPTLNAVEIFVVVDSFLFQRYFDAASSTDTLTRVEVAELNIRRDYSLVVNGVSLRYEAIEDPDLQIYCTVSGFHIVRERGGNFPLPEEVQYSEGGVPLTEGGKYLGDLRALWTTIVNDNVADAVMVFTGAELISIDENGEISWGVEGIAYLSAACWSTKVSLNEASGSFFTTAVIAAHELGHNLGSPHDGEGLSQECSKSNNYIMSYLSVFYESSLYKINPWRFSRCSVEAMKRYINGLGSNNCMTNLADPYDLAEYAEHLSKLPGELHDVDAQCKLIQGKDSKLCASTDMSNICLVMKCLAPDQDCKLYTAARGTTCGTDKWCIDGACVSKTTAPPNNNCEDRGYSDYSCTTLRNGYMTMADFCHTWSSSCCKTCKKLMGCWYGNNSQEYTGFVSWTKNGRTCQAWVSQEHHTHKYHTDQYFPLDGTAADAENNCRDPDNDGKPWCYTTNDDIRWEYCDIPICDVDCFRKAKPEQYKGKVSKLADGTQCQAWSEQEPHTQTYNQPAMFPNDESVVAANNYCRDPSNDGKPWCYTVIKNKRWDFCPIQRCD